MSSPAFSKPVKRSSTAERVRRYRERQRKNIKPVLAEVTWRDRERMVDVGLLAAKDADQPTAIVQALGKAAQRFLKQHGWPACGTAGHGRTWATSSANCSTCGPRSAMRSPRKLCRRSKSQAPEGG